MRMTLLICRLAVSSDQRLGKAGRLWSIIFAAELDVEPRRPVVKLAASIELRQTSLAGVGHKLTSSAAGDQDQQTGSAARFH